MSLHTSFSPWAICEIQGTIFLLLRFLATWDTCLGIPHSWCEIKSWKSFYLEQESGCKKVTTAGIATVAEGIQKPQECISTGVIRLFHLVVLSHADIPLLVWGVRCHIYLFLLPYIRAFLSRTKGLCKWFVVVVVKKYSKFEIGELCFSKPFHKFLSDHVPGSWQYEATSFQTVNRGNDQIHPAVCPISLKYLGTLILTYCLYRLSVGHGGMVGQLFCYALLDRNLCEKEQLYIPGILPSRVVWFSTKISMFLIT